MCLLLRTILLEIAIEEVFMEREEVAGAIGG